MFHWTLIEKCNRWSINMPQRAFNVKRTFQHLKPRILFVLPVMRTGIFKMIFIHSSSIICKFPFTEMINKYQTFPMEQAKAGICFLSKTMRLMPKKVQNYWGKVLATQTSTFICFLRLNVCYDRSQPFCNFYSTVKSGQRKARTKISIYWMLII